MKKRKGFTLIELVVVIAILALMVIILTGSIDPILMVAKANDARRKKDLARIKVAFEEYFNDTGCYPTGEIMTRLSNAANCGSSTVFGQWINKWPCDPERRTPYIIVVEDGSCPNWYKIFTNLMNRNDNDIPEGWYENDEEYYVFAYGQLTINDANYGVSSTNVSWYERQIPAYCQEGCFRGTGATNCNHTARCTGGNCYTDHDCRPGCKVASCP